MLFSLAQVRVLRSVLYTYDSLYFHAFYFDPNGILVLLPVHWFPLSV